ncbi:putative cytochrome P450 hydroxylase [[Actinomadura] parvosata subsp. kistnae]|uniref:Cytochrome n=1 Tax=[Actinomadura] parvosata subsp. kistnae TaxID=1909395 RepID=A0A1V0AHD1_9ACTN|nr:cytochrome P450 [Nonomuraea sp. ATCC 55076]AQZ69616.1 cytochrome [Nonomuraea sp. ATCC 55076]SPL91688.1 putative cytochrome P450 hydroxylase [Actinomadura parvosata subsp. kistnae]
MSVNEQVLSYPIPAEAPLEPPAEWAELRGGCPVAHVKLPSGDAARLITRYEDVKQVLADPRFTRQLTAPDAARLSADGGGVFNSDVAQIIPDSGDGHLHWRRLVGKWFTAKRMAAMRPRMAEIADSLIDDLVERGAPGDLRAGLGFPLPVYVICDMLGVPAEDRERFSYWSDTLLNLTRYGKEEIEAAQAEFFQYMSDLIAAKRAEPGDDLLSELLAAGGPDEGGLEDLQIIVTGMALLVAGHETTANMIGKMVSMLLADRARWEALLADPSLVRTAVEETLRLDANSGFGLPRYLPVEAEIGGETLPKGTTVICSMAAANRDESAFEDAASMDLTRSPNPHLAFGAGAHSCLGQSLARTELQVVLEVLLRRLPTLELAVPVAELERVEGLAVGGLRTVPVRW